MSNVDTLICPICDCPIESGEEMIWVSGVPAYHESCPDEEYRISPPEGDLMRVFIPITSGPVIPGRLLSAGNGVYIVPTGRSGLCSDAWYIETFESGHRWVDGRPATYDEICKHRSDRILDAILDLLELGSTRI